MSAWRREAIVALPEYRALVDQVSSPMSLWIELSMEFADVLEAGNQDLVRRILGYAVWCFSDQAGRLPNETSTAVVCAFYEHLPKRSKHWPWFRDWFAPAMFERLRPCFAYHLTELELIELVDCYTGKPLGQAYRKNRS